MNRLIEVRVRKGITLFFVGVAALGLVPVSRLAAQSPGSQTTSGPATIPPDHTTPPAAIPPDAPAPPATIPSDAVQTPTPENQKNIESRPGYQQQPTDDPGMMPKPEKAPRPVVTSAPPTAQTPYTALPPYAPNGMQEARDILGSTYIPVDSWVYPAMMRLYSMGYLDTMYLSMRPYTRRSALHILQASEDAILGSDDEQAQEILAALLNELADEGITRTALAGGERGTVYGVQSVYTRMLGISGPILEDSYHLGQTFYNDYGRPENPGFNNITGFSTVNEQGPFSLYLRGEYQHAPSGPGYSQSLSAVLSQIDGIPYGPPNYPQATIPSGPIAGQNPFRLVEATLSYHILGHEISGGKSDAWLGPGMGGAMDWSNNAENIYSFRINRVEPLNIKYLSRLVGPVRYDFFYGSLKGHTYPNDDYVHSEMFSFQPTRDFQFGFQRTVIFGGEGHEPVTIRTFLKGFFDTNDTNQAEKYSRDDPGARFSAFNFSYRIPFVRKYITLYSDSETHDDLTPVSAPRRAAYRPGIYLSHIPGASRLDLRVEGVSTDCSTLVCQYGSSQYIETIQRQGYTNKGFIFGDWIGREAKGGQAWLTYHLSGNEWVQAEFLHKQTPGDFIPGAFNATTGTYRPGGTTQNQFRVDVLKRISPDIEVHSWYQHERWVAPIYLTGVQTNNTFTVQVTFFPKLRTTAE